MKDVVILPTYNERSNVVKIIHSIFDVLPNINIVVVDDNSPDGTGKEVLNLKAVFPNLSLISRKNKEGLGKAYAYAFNEVLRDKDVRNVIMMDADLSHDPKYLPEMLSNRPNFNVIVGSRYIKGGDTVGWEMWRRLLSRFGNIYCHTITRMPIYDCTSGFILIDADMLRRINFLNMDMSGYAFIMELKYSLYLLGSKFKEIPIIFKNRAEGESKISNHIIREGIIAPWKMILKK